MKKNQDIAAELALKLGATEKNWSEPGKTVKQHRMTVSCRITPAHNKTVKLMAVEFGTSSADIIEAAIDLISAADNGENKNLAQVIDKALSKLK
jgi:hypothetical protein